MDNIDDLILASISNPEINDVGILELVKTKYRNIKLKPKTLGVLLEVYVDIIGWEDEEEKISPEILIEDLLEINIGYQSENGCQWARSDNSYLGKKYKIHRKIAKSKVYSIQLLGENDSAKRNRSIRSDIVKELSTKRCAILDVGTRIEIDHKNGRYDDKEVADLKTQKLEDFQPLSKAANDAKRQHCKECIRDSKRYDAMRLGYSNGWIKGDSDTENCIGCYWYDPREFNKEISQNYKKKVPKESLAKENKDED